MQPETSIHPLGYVHSDHAGVDGGRLRFRGPAAQADSVAVSMYLLSRLAISPRSLEQITQLLARGCVLLEYFGVYNPVPMFSVDVGGADHQRLSQAVRENVSSSRYLAALKALRWREPDKAFARQKYFDAISLRLRDEMPWPSQEDFRRDRGGAGTRHEQTLIQLRSAIDAVVQRRLGRLSILATAAAPGVGSWTDLLADAVAFASSPIEPAIDEGEGGATDSGDQPRVH